MTAIASEDPVVLLIDEIDKTDQEFEAMLLELLSDFQISIPELGRIEARTHPVVLLTSNNTRELTEALKRRCLYLWLDYPELEHELAIVRLHSPELDETVARKLVEIIAAGARARPEEAARASPSRSTGRGRCCCSAPRTSTRRRSSDTMSVIVKHRTDLDTVAARVGVKLEPGRRCPPPASRSGYVPIDADPAARAASTLTCSSSPRSCATEGVAIGTSEMLDAFEALAHVPWTEPGRLQGGARRDARQVAG